MKICIAMLVLCAAWPALADQKLAEKKNCLACHGVKEKIVGPSLRDVAARYAGKADAPAMLAEKIRKGGAGNWGDMAMPPNDVTAEEAKTLADWVLATK